MQRAYGRVIEIGPGSGNQLSRYDASKVTRLYGVEPNVALHKTLRKTAEDLGLGDRFTIVPYGIEDFDKLREYGIEEGSADTVMSVSVLCSVPNPQNMTKAMYKLLKPSGQVIVHEHVASEDTITCLVQSRPLFILSPVVQTDRPEQPFSRSIGRIYLAVAASSVPLRNTCRQPANGRGLSSSLRMLQMRYAPSCPRLWVEW